MKDSKPLYTSEDMRREDAASPRPETDSEYRSPWRRDFARLVHSPAFRRLQGKTQLFPSVDHDFFRNRLTHSIEVAQIAKGIAERLNYIHPPFRAAKRSGDESRYISVDLVEFAALAHDLGHPPFGHTGEAALDECMRAYGGFEGNAQTLRILARVEKKRTKHWPPKPFTETEDCRRGLNLTFRSLASVIKYDAPIPPTRSASDHLRKGYYSTEQPLVEAIKRAVIGNDTQRRLYTLECSIMDLADDIAYSTYDLEDALKAGFVSLIDLLNIENNRELLGKVTVKVWRALNNRQEPWVFSNNPAEWENQLPEDWRTELEETKEKIIDTLKRLCADLLPEQEANQIAEETTQPLNPNGVEQTRASETTGVDATLRAIREACNISRMTSTSGYLRTDLTSQLVNEFINAVNIEYNPDIPALSRCVIVEEQKLRIETLKHLTYELHISSARLKTVEYRGKEIVRNLFRCLSSSEGEMLLPEDWQSVASFYRRQGDEAGRMRAVCDYIAGMTDRYAIDLYGRLTSELPQSIFKAH